MKPNVIAAEVIGIIGVALSLFIYISKNRKHIVVAKFASDIVWLMNYLLLGAYTGVVLNVIAMGRECVFYHRGEKKWASHRIWLYIFVALTLVSPLVELVGRTFTPLSIIPAIGSAFIAISMYMTKPSHMRYVGYLAYTPWLIYNICIGSIAASISSAFTLVSALVGNVRDILSNRAKASSEEAAADE